MKKTNPIWVNIAFLMILLSSRSLFSHFFSFFSFESAPGDVAGSPFMGGGSLRLFVFFLFAMLFGHFEQVPETGGNAV